MDPELLRSKAAALNGKAAAYVSGASVTQTVVNGSLKAAGLTISAPTFLDATNTMVGAVAA